jgi:hypothetical protein
MSDGLSPYYHSRSALDPAITPQEPPSSSSAPVVASPDVTCSVNVGEFVLPDLAEVAGDDREAEEAAVISLLANQLSSHHSSLVNAVSETREPPFPPAATTAPSSPLLRDDDVDDHLHGQADRLEDVMAAVIPATETKTKQRKKAAKRSSNKRKKTPKAAPEKVKKAKAEPIPCPEEGCPFVAVYNKDMIRHKRIHTGECTNILLVHTRTFHFTYYAQVISSSMCSSGTVGSFFWEHFFCSCYLLLVILCAQVKGHSSVQLVRRRSRGRTS